MFKTISTLSQEEEEEAETRTLIDTDGDGNIDRIEFDLDQDGNINRIAHLDEAGRWVQVELDMDDDGTIDRITHYAFDSGGNRRVTRRDADLDDDGNIDRIAHLDTDGRWERVELDADDDGTTDRITHYAFDSGGNRRVTRRDFDLDGDGTIDRTVHLNAEGRWERLDRDVDDDGTIDRVETYTYFSDGRLVQTRFDDNNDGMVDRRETYVYRVENGEQILNRTRFDDDNDGSTDRTEIYTYDDDGNRTRISFDDDNDGNIDRTVRLNAAGRWAEIERDVNDDGTLDRSETYTYDENGNLIRINFDDDRDSIIDRVEIYTYDENGNRTRAEFDLDDDGNIDRTLHLNAVGRWERVEWDDDDDGAIDRSADYTHNADNNRIQTDFDDDADGTANRIIHYTFDDDGNGRVTRRDADLDDDGNIDRIAHLDTDGRWERVEWDDDDDGTIDRSEDYTHNADNNRIQIDFDDDADGTADRIIHYTFDDDGNGRVTRRDSDLDDDGTIDWTVHLNAAGRWEREEWDDDDDGTIDRTVHRNTDGTNTLNRTDFDDDGDGTTDRSEFYTQNADNNRNRTDFDDDGDGTIDRSETYTYDANGNLNRTNFDDDNDGTIDRSETYTYDDDGNRTRINFDDDNDGTTDRIETYTYNANGRVSQTRFDDNNDDTIDRIEFYTYNPDGRVSQTRFDDNNDDTIDRIEFYTYNPDGRVSQTRFDDNNDDTIDRIEFYTYNPDGRVSQTRFDDNNDDTIDRIEFYAYNPDGRVSQTDFDDDADGTIDRIERALSSLDGSKGFILAGIDAYDQSGWSVSSAGDVNGDGYDDLIIGAIYADPNRDSQAGETYIVYGGASAPGTNGVLDLSTLNGTNGFILTGIDAFDRSGSSVSSAGDVNGDGYDDLIIGAFSADPNGDSYAGEAYIVYGGANAPGTDSVLDLSDLDGTNGFILNGIDPSDETGYSVSSAGDVNGDGYDDLIIGARYADPNGDGNAGETYLVYGGASAPGRDGVLDLSALDGTNGFTLTGIDALDQSGWSVSAAGDVNGDGYDDLIIGARDADPNGNSEAGETYIVYGGASAPGTNGVLDLSTLNGTNGFILTGIDAGDRSGFSVSSAGDVNGDGYDDLIIGARGAAPRGDSLAGETYVVYGGASAPGTDGVLDLGALNGTNGFTLTGIDGRDYSGWSVSAAGDVNGDGYDDLIIGARDADPNGNGAAGEIYIVYGGASTPGTNGVLDLSDLDGTNGFILTGIGALDQSGRSVSSAGDVNGDGYDDLIIGARYGDPNGGDSGETYVVYGGATGMESLVPVTAQGTAAADNFTGNAGDDSLTAIATNDVVRGGAGDDTIQVTALDFAAIDGGTGQDTLVLDGAGLTLDLTGPGNAGVDSVELFDLSGTGANSLVLDALAVFDVTEEREGGMASLDVLGDVDDSVDLSGSNFALTGTATENGVTYNVYRDGNAEVRIEEGVTVTLAAAGAQNARSKTDTKTDTGIDPVADPRTDPRTDPGTDPGSGTIRLDGALMNPDPLMNNDLWNNDLWDGLWVDGVNSLDQPVHIDEDAIFIPLSDPLSFGPLASGSLPGPWGNLIYWPGLESHPVMQNDLAMILPEMEIVTADMEGF